MTQPIWHPSDERINQSNMSRFINYVNDRNNSEFQNYSELYDWSVQDIPDFWASLWAWSDITSSCNWSDIVDDPAKMPGAKWFSGTRLNYAENLLKYRDDKTALVFRGEGGTRVHLTYKQLYRQVARLASSLRAIGLQSGDRAAGFMPNIPETVIAMLAVTSIGAVWTSCSPDFGANGVLDRFGQTQPKVLFTADGYSYNGKTFNSLEQVGRLVKQIPSISKVIVVPFISKDPDVSDIPGAVRFDEFVNMSVDCEEIEFEQVPGDHPLFILYSSGTTGVPKCIVHGVAGTLIQHIKELKLHTDVTREDTIFYYTTCGWMMWNWLISSLSLGAGVVLYDGSPFYPDPEAMWRIVAEEKITIFGTSAKYLSAQEAAGVMPGESCDLKSLKTILSTGSPLLEESYDYVYSKVKPDVQLSSISGGTDIISCFALGNPIDPVYRGQLQVRGLGMKVEAYDAQGRSIIGQKGELVCTAAFPSMPIGFWNDDSDQGNYRRAYFGAFPGVWHHGDFIEITDRGALKIYGRSDATLNPGGVRIGTAEIYRQVDTIPKIADSLLVGQEWDDDVRIILFVKPVNGTLLDEQMIQMIRATIRQNCTPRHVPAKIIAVEDIPYTLNGKKVELAVREAIHGRPVKNKDALANPEALDLYVDHPQLKT